MLQYPLVNCNVYNPLSIWQEALLGDVGAVRVWQVRGVSLFNTSISRTIRVTDET